MGTKEWTEELDFNLKAGDRDVVSVDYILINGEEHRRLTLHHDVWIEGIGSLYAGVFSKWGTIPGNFMGSKLVSVYDGDKCIFSLDEYDQSENSALYGKMFSDGAHWDYIIDEKTIFPAYLVDDSEGTITINGITYNKLYRLAVEYNETSGWLNMLVDPIGIREEAGKVYCNYEEFCKQLGELREKLRRWGLEDLPDAIPYQQTENGELLIYDFTVEMLDWYPTSPEYDGLYVSGIESVVTNDGVSRKLFLLSNGLRILEGVGCLNSTGLFLYYLYDQTSISRIFGIGNEKVELYSYDNGEKTIFRNHNFNTTTDIRANLNKVEDVHVIYDLQGRRLTATPQRGVYIRDGKKYVVKE
jgi:hypothetical protein